MIIGIGCDVVNHKTLIELKWDTDAKLLQKYFSVKELELVSTRNKLKFIAGRFAAKEAVLKSLGTGMEDGIALTEIQILQLSNGKPIIELEGKVKEIANSLGIKLFQLSISHSVDCSVAFIVAEGY